MHIYTHTDVLTPYILIVLCNDLYNYTLFKHFDCFPRLVLVCDDQRLIDCARLLFFLLPPVLCLECEYISHAPLEIEPFLGLLSD